LTEAAARAGHTVHAGLRDVTRGAALERLRGEGLAVTPVRLDVTDPESVDAAVAAAAAGQPIDVLVNNAGYEVLGPIESLSDDDLRSQFETNVYGPVRLIRAVVPAMRARKQGRIVNVTSVMGHIAVPHRGAYAASKHAFEAIAKTLWLELRPFDIQVVAIVPGTYATNFAANYVYVEGFTEDSAYWPAELELREKMGGFIKAHQPRNAIGDAAQSILLASTEPNPPFHWVIGSDAVELLPANHAKSFESFIGDWFGALGMNAFQDLT
jgi:NAD(P)-dependent dehydrogenase (short-subunit alcohol dehydrogenase family)